MTARRRPPLHKRLQSVLPRASLRSLMAVLVLANAAAWLWALSAFHAQPVLLGMALAAWGLGLRHALDADHLAAIDNVTRLLLQRGQQALGTGFYFACGHATVVFAMSLAVAVYGAPALAQWAPWKSLGAAFGTAVSGIFLCLVALANLVVFSSLYGAVRRLQQGGPRSPLAGGLIARLGRPLFALVGRSWQMFPLGLLFGLGFDTASEISLLALSASEHARGLSLSAVLVFPALFLAGMALLDTADGALMLRAWQWSAAHGARAQDLRLTGLAAVFALLIGTLEMLQLAGHFSPVEPVLAQSGWIGAVMLLLFALLMLGSRMSRSGRRYDGAAT